MIKRFVEFLDSPKPIAFTATVFFCGIAGTTLALGFYLIGLAVM